MKTGPKQLRKRRHSPRQPSTASCVPSALVRKPPFVPPPSISAFLGTRNSLHRTSCQPIPAYSAGGIHRQIRPVFRRSPFAPVRFSPIQVYPCKSVVKYPAKTKITKRTHFMIKTENTQGSRQNCLRCLALYVRYSTFPNGHSRYIPWFALSNRPEYRIGIPRRCIPNAGLSIVIEESSRELRKKQFDRIGNRMDHLMIVMAAGKTLIVSSDARGTEVVGCKKLVTRTGVQQPATKPKRQQLYFTHATPLEK
jgi:hypothetical protein